MQLQALLVGQLDCFDEKMAKRSGNLSTVTIFGVDPGTRRLGFGWIEVDARSPETVIARGCGVIEPDPKGALASRLASILSELQIVFAERQPDRVIVEKVFLGKSVTSAFILGESRGVVLAVAASHGAEIFETAAKTAKKSVTGRGNAEKTEVRLILDRVLGLGGELETLPLDASDGLALAYQGWRDYVLERRTGEVQI